jgi:hypothetical protein
LSVHKFLTKTVRFHNFFTFLSPVFTPFSRFLL